jgi:ATP-dependent protease ClpP protease subunit
MQMVPAVTELIVAELMYLEKNGQGSPIEMLINSSGTTRQDGEIVSARRCAETLLRPAHTSNTAATAQPRRLVWSGLGCGTTRATTWT